MNPFDLYVQRLGASGETFKDSYINHSKNIARSRMLESPNRTDIYLNLDENDKHYCITRDREGYRKKIFVFYPDTKVDIGTYSSQLDDNGRVLHYLITEKHTQEITPTFVGELCTYMFKVKYEDIKVNLGLDKMDRPIIEVIEGEIKELPCIVKFNDASTAIAESNKPINQLGNIVTISITYTEAPSIDENEQFELYGDNYRIIKIDRSNSMDKVGVLKITGERTGRVK